MEPDEHTCVPDLAVEIHDILASKRYISEHQNDGLLILRFSTFAHALLAKKTLSDLNIADRSMSVDFSPRRLSFIQTDDRGRQWRSEGEPVRGRFVDFMTPPASAVYDDEKENPFWAFGIQV